MMQSVGVKERMFPGFEFLIEDPLKGKKYFSLSLSLMSFEIPMALLHLFIYLFIYYHVFYKIIFLR